MSKLRGQPNGVLRSSQTPAGMPAFGDPVRDALTKDKDTAARDQIDNISLHVAFRKLRDVGLIDYRILKWGNAIAMVSPQNWLYLGGYRRFREEILRESKFLILARLGPADDRPRLSATDEPAT